MRLGLMEDYRNGAANSMQRSCSRCSC